VIRDEGCSDFLRICKMTIFSAMDIHQYLNKYGHIRAKSYIYALRLRNHEKKVFQ